jgi:hypothetical protein
MIRTLILLRLVPLQREPDMDPKRVEHVALLEHVGAAIRRQMQRAGGVP